MKVLKRGLLPGVESDEDEDDDDYLVEDQDSSSAIDGEDEQRGNNLIALGGNNVGKNPLRKNRKSSSINSSSEGAGEGDLQEVEFSHDEDNQSEEGGFTTSSGVY